MSITCNGCHKKDTVQVEPLNHRWMRLDYHGIFTGYYCDECYDSDRYPYRKDDYTHGTGVADDGTPVNDEEQMYWDSLQKERERYYRDWYESQLDDESLTY